MAKLLNQNFVGQFPIALNKFEPYNLPTETKFIAGIFLKY